MYKCNHDSVNHHWDYCSCEDCGWVVPGGEKRGPNNGWFPSFKAVEEYDKYKFYPGINEIKPIKR